MIKRALLLLILICISCKEEDKLLKNVQSGQVFGTYYNIQFFDTQEKDFKKSYDSIFSVLNQSMSTYLPDSDISKINAGDSLVVVDDHFKRVFDASKVIYNETKGYFDPTIGILVNAWRFGPKKEKIELDSLKIDSMMLSVGFDKVKLEAGKIKKLSDTFIDYNAIAKGYALDVIATFLDSKGYQNYLIDIGGEIRAKGKNLISEKLWSVGIENPNFDGSQSYTKIVTLQDESMATSGVYRKFKIDEQGKRYSHILNPKTGYPSKTNILSVSVISPNCMEADAYATAFKALGIEWVRKFLEKRSELKVYFIYEDENKELQTLALNGFPES